jgi:hypothetical protein
MWHLHICQTEITSKASVNLITTFYFSNSDIRQRELDLALHRNIQKSIFSKIHLLIQPEDFEKLKYREEYLTIFRSSVIRLVVVNSQPTYQGYLNYAKSLSDQICCIANNDIEFELSPDSFRLFEIILRFGQRIGLFLTRHEADGSSPLIDNFGGSHDAFVFYSNTLNALDSNFSELNYIQNTPGIEALLTIFFGRVHNFELLNPCREFKAIHHHRSNWRPWNIKRITPVGYTSPIRRPDLSGVHNDLMIRPMVLR